jgi:hypothetical protein
MGSYGVTSNNLVINIKYKFNLQLGKHSLFGINYWWYFIIGQGRNNKESVTLHIKGKKEGISLTGSVRQYGQIFIYI